MDCGSMPMKKSEQEAPKVEVVQFVNPEDGRDVSSSIIRTNSWYEMTLLDAQE